VSEGSGSRGRVEGLIESLLKEIGEDPSRTGLARTPRRVANALAFFTHGYRVDPREVLNNAVFEENYDEMVLVRDIDFYSLCEHHVLPFFGRAHIAYMPAGRIVGLSKLARLVEIYARRLQVQERLTNEVAGALWDVLRPKGVAVVLEAQHLCMQMRGVEKQNSVTITSAMRGEFEANPKTRTEFMELIRHRR
jgi:GTP cyclohydrolase I